MIETTKVLVLDVAEGGVKVAVNGENQWLTWDSLRSACGHDDAGLAKVYQRINREATAKAADGPVVISVGQDHTNVWWVATVSAAFGGGEANYPRRRDQGGTHAHAWMARREAEEIAKRLGKRCVGIREHGGFGV